MGIILFAYFVISTIHISRPHVSRWSPLPERVVDLSWLEAKKIAPHTVKLRATMDALCSPRE